jgi:ketosteroid isomerase-like protein
VSAVTAQAVVGRFFTAFYAGDVAAARDTITEDFTLVGPFATAHNADEFIDLATGLLQIVRGHRVLRWVVEGDTVAALYEISLRGPAGVQPLTTGGWFTVAGDRVTSGQLIYDRMAFDAIVGSA